jgi:CubicO group peptidase (beta-lactamase class C family)
MSNVTDPLGLGPLSPVVAGDVAPGFESLREAFATGMSQFGAGGGAFAAYVDGRVVADLWGGWARPGSAWVEDTLAVLFSATKGLTAMAVQVLADRGELDVDAPVAMYWPEFAQAGKRAITVRQVLNHTAGVLSFPGHAELLHGDGRGYGSYDAIAEGLAAAVPAWPPGTRHGYHMKTHGWILGELVRRITGQTIGTFVREAICDPLSLDLSIGTAPDIQPRVARVIDALEDDAPPESAAIRDALRSALNDPGTLLGQANLATGVARPREALVNSPLFLEAEFASGGATGDARSLARLFAMLAGDGSLDGVRILSAASVHAWSQHEVCGPDVLVADLGLPGADNIVRRTLGYLLLNPPTDGLKGFESTPTAVGVMGLGGQVAFCDRAHALAVGFVRSQLTQRSELSDRLIRTLYSCVASGETADPEPR